LAKSCCLRISLCHLQIWSKWNRSSEFQWAPAGRSQDGGFGCNAPTARTWKGRGLGTLVLQVHPVFLLKLGLATTSDAFPLYHVFTMVLPWFCNLPYLSLTIHQWKANPPIF
jgi:hypothetical protein